MLHKGKKLLVLKYLKYSNALFGDNVEFVNIKHCGTPGNHFALKGQIRDSDAINFIEAEGQLFFYY
jgi:hypothetical protein